MKKIKKLLFKKIEDCEFESDVYSNNEIKTNVLMGKVIIAMASISFLFLLLMSFGILDPGENFNWIVSLVLLCIQILIIIINLATKGHLLYAKYALIFSAIIDVCYYLCMFGSEIIVHAVIPMFLAVRYYNYKFTRNIVTIAILMTALGVYIYYLNGGVNLNMFYIDGPGVTFDANSSITLIGTSRETYIYTLFIYDFLFDFLVLLILAYIACFITNHGRKMIEEESEIIEQTTRINTEIALATEIQANMLPCNYPAFPEYPNIDLFAVNYPAREMGGDFYDYLKIDDDHIAILMADVSGKGVGAAFFMSVAKSSIDFTLTEYNIFSPAEHLKLNNHYLYKNNTASLFVTCWLGIYQISTNKLTYANAGHNPPILIKKGKKPEYLKSKSGLVLAGRDNSQYTDNIIELNKGDEIILYTDGITEAINIKEELFGEARFLEEVEKIRSLSCLDQVNSINLTLKEYMKDTEQFDDITLLSMKIKD